MSRLAVVIVSWNVRELLASCLRSLFFDLQRAGLGADVWVVDNASTDGTPEMVSQDFPSVHLLAEQENHGFAAGNNLALRRILDRPDTGESGEFVWLLNPDTEIQPGATTSLVEALDASPRMGVAGARLLYADGTHQQSAFRFPGLVQLIFELFPTPSRLYNTRLNGRYPRHLYESHSAFPIDHPLGASMMVRGATIKEIGLLDEGYRMYCEEIDWCWRMRKANWHAVCVPEARVIHHAGRSTSQVPVRSFANLWISRARLYARHHGPLTWRLARCLVRVGMRRRMAGAPPEMFAACQSDRPDWLEAR